MNIKKLMSVSLLFFVFFSAAYLVYKEFYQKGEKANTSTETQTHIKSPVQKSIHENKVTVARKIIPKSQKTEKPAQHVPQDSKSKVIAYYFHGTHRCTTCLTIEKYSREAIEKYFTKKLQDGKLEFKPLNIDESENQHYIQDYQLYTKSLVLTLHKGKKQVDWKNLTDVWSYVSEKEKFYQYVKDETERYLQEID